ncbi:hypothetical protein KSP40_PGU018727 [Platanthera guangdongensis]|uniref:Uncharacterized protein n=1 Tax=Platanthera guangdongensis TaxID=2320717 RepID=A0ABR2MIE8_9ASPA
MPTTGSLVYYSPQGHAEHAQIPPLQHFHHNSTSHSLPRRLRQTHGRFQRQYLRHYKNDPINPDEQKVEDNKVFSRATDRTRRRNFSITQKVTQYDATSSFSIQKYCFDYIFPKLDYTATTLVQILPVKDIHEKNGISDIFS